ncbi:MAG: prepilin-type N-terminal cleavage/methylation domain-containing protein [bacterium]|nr:prepilin-type N-terminal cleavage/methylation domain-containing protein [bacterium]
MKKGFTLIELVIVLAIIGIFTAIVFGSITTSRSKARDNSRIADMKTIQLALALYYDVNQIYPVDFRTLDDVGQKYLPSIPKDPQTQQDYVYNLSGDKYCLGVTLEDSNAIPNDNVASCGSEANYWASR